MSSTLRWQPVTDGRGMTDATKFIMRELFGEPVDTTLREDAIGILRGAAAGTNEAKVKKELLQLMAAIEKYGEVKVKEEF